jgi:hypothetical protein
MPDISMCKGGNCPHKEKCYRFMAEPSYYQTYFAEPPNKGDKCDYYWGENAQSIWLQLEEIVKLEPKK